MSASRPSSRASSPLPKSNESCTRSSPLAFLLSDGFSRTRSTNTLRTHRYIASRARVFLSPSASQWSWFVYGLMGRRQEDQLSEGPIDGDVGGQFSSCVRQLRAAVRTRLDAVSALLDEARRAKNATALPHIMHARGWIDPECAHGVQPNVLAFVREPPTPTRDGGADHGAPRSAKHEASSSSSSSSSSMSSSNGASSASSLGAGRVGERAGARPRGNSECELRELQTDDNVDDVG